MAAKVRHGRPARDGRHGARWRRRPCSRARLRGADSGRRPHHDRCRDGRRGADPRQGQRHHHREEFRKLRARGRTSERRQLRNLHRIRRGHPRLRRQATGYSSTAGKLGPKAALSAAGTAKHVGIARRTSARRFPSRSRRRGSAPTPSPAACSPSAPVLADLRRVGKLVAAVHGDKLSSKLIKINKGAAASADGDEITVEIVSSFLAVDN